MLGEVTGIVYILRNQSSVHLIRLNGEEEDTIPCQGVRFISEKI